MREMHNEFVLGLGTTTKKTMVIINCARRHKKKMSGFRVCSYNVLAQCYVKSEWFSWTQPKSLLKWKHRRERLRIKLRDELKADIFCLQEVEDFTTDWKDFIENELNMGCFYKQRTQKSNNKRDGSLVCWNKDKFEILSTKGIEFNEVVTKLLEANEEEKKEYERDCIAACVMLLHKASNVRIACVSTHLYWDPAKAFVKLKQAEYLRQEIERWTQTNCILIGGDFNSLATSDVYKSMIENNYVSLMRDDETGQEPIYTNVTPSFTETIDYIFASNTSTNNWIRTVTPGKVKERDLLFDGCPCQNEPSDHLPIYCDVELAYVSE